MKKRLGLIFLTIILSLVLLMGCSDTKESEGKLRNGKYLAKSPVDNGYFSIAVMDIKNGEISSFNYSEIIATIGEEKNKENHGDFMEEILAIEKLNEQFNENKDLEEMDYEAISTPDEMKEIFEELVEELLEKAENGDVHIPVYTDGEYTAKADEDIRGWLGEVNIVIRDGQIIGLDYFEAAMEELESRKSILDENGEPIIGNDGKPQTELVQVGIGERKSNENYNFPELFDTINSVQKLVINKNGIENIEVDVMTGSTGSRDIMMEVIEKALEDGK